MSKCLKCDICGIVCECDLNGLAIMNSEQVSGNLKSWKDRETIDLKVGMLHNSVIVMDICDDCKEQIIHEIERQMEMKNPSLTEAVE